jgi:glycosyltransferase involved in cell wall biosynthesis
MSSVEYLEEALPKFDVVILSRARFAAKYLAVTRAANPRPFVIFDTVDLHHLREERLAELTRDPLVAQHAAELRAIELSVMRASDMAWVTSTHEADLLRRSDASLRLEVVPNVHEIRRNVPGFGSREDLLFIGGFRHPPNEDAVLYFVHEILPLVRQEIPDVKLKIVGSHMPASIRALASQSVEVLGFVRNVEPIFDAVRLSVAPLRYGAGVKGKITQSLAWGVPVVTTPVGAEGISVDEDHIVVASTAQEFARRLVTVYQDEQTWARLSDQGRQLIDAQQGYLAIRAKLAQLLERAHVSADADRDADAPGLSAMPPRADVTYIRGFLDPEGENGSRWRWMGAEGVIRVRNTRRDMLLTIKGRAPVQLIEAPTIRFEFGGAPLDEIVGNDAVDRSYEIRAAQQSRGATTELRIRTSRTFVPRDFDPSSPDGRHLGFTVYNVDWQEK